MNARISIGGASGFSLDHGIPVRSGRMRSPTWFRGGDQSLADVMDGLFDMIAPSPWSAHAGLSATHRGGRAKPRREPLYTPEQRVRRDGTRWTLVQGVLAPLQFLVFAISLGLVVRYLMTGEGYSLATASILLKTVILYTIMITGAIWEKVVFGKYLFARAFFWEDVFSMLVLTLQTTYVTALLFGWAGPRGQMMIAIAAYAVYVVNAAQFVLKLRAARLDAARSSVESTASAGGTA